MTELCSVGSSCHTHQLVSNSLHAPSDKSLYGRAVDMASRDSITGAILDRSAHFRESQHEITPRKCRRVLEQDLGLRIGELDKAVLKRFVTDSLQSICVEVGRWIFGPASFQQALC